MKNAIIFLVLKVKTSFWEEKGEFRKKNIPLEKRKEFYLNIY